MSDGPTVHVDADLEDLIPKFMQRRRDDVEVLRAHLAAEEYEPIRIMGHTLKGTAGGYGFEQLSAIGAAIEQAAKRGDAASVRACAEEMEDFLNRVTIHFRVV